MLCLVVMLDVDGDYFVFNYGLLFIEVDYVLVL